jgi:hypothetical protein
VSATVPTGLDAEALESTLGPIDEFAQRELPERVVIGLDQCDEFPDQLARRAAPAPATVGRDAPADRFAEFPLRGCELMGGREGGLAPSAEPVVITGSALGLPGAERLFGKVRGRLEGCRAIELAWGADADALAPIRAAMGS